MTDTVGQIDAEAFEVLTFDCYGTLIDWQRGIVDSLQPMLLRHDSHVIDDFVLEFFAQTEPVVEAAGGKYADVLTEVLARLGKRLGFTPTDDELAAFPASLGDWQPFPDTVDALAQLNERFALVVISNVDDALFAKTNEILGVDFTHIITAEQVGAYKPDPKMFETALTTIGADPSRVLHVAQSLFHDIVPASALGLSTAWIDRNQGGPGAALNADAAPTWTFPTLAAFADAALA